MKRGYFGIGIYYPKKSTNVGTLWRSALNFGASFIFVIGARYQRQPGDTQNVAAHVPFYEFNDWESFLKFMPINCHLIGIEKTEKSLSIKSFFHRERSVYILGAEDNGLPFNVFERCYQVVHIDTPFCLNVATAGSIIMFDRQQKENNNE